MQTSFSHRGRDWLDAGLLASARQRFAAVLGNGGAELDMAAVITAFERGSS
jgi:hypothetical protein